MNHLQGFSSRSVGRGTQDSVTSRVENCLRPVGAHTHGPVLTSAWAGEGGGTQAQALDAALELS